MTLVRPAPRPPATASSVIALSGQSWRGWVVGLIYLACAVAFVADLTHDVTWAFGVFYIPLVCTAVFYRDPRFVWWLAAIAIGMVVLGWFFPVVNFGTASLVNRLLSIAAILATATLVRLARSMQDRLTSETLRAQAADRMKTQIFANLSHELRTPLNAIIGFAELLQVDARPDQQNSLEHLQSAGHRLQTTIENLLDLAQAADRVLRTDRLDLAAVLRRAIDARRHDATERHITLATSLCPETRAVGDAWAVQRIADNLICNAVKFTPPGGTVRVATQTADGSALLVVEDTGDGMSAEVLRQLGEPFFQAKSGLDRPYEGMGTGLALCRKLADAMGATLSFASEPGRGTTVRLCLRAF